MSPSPKRKSPLSPPTLTIEIEPDPSGSRAEIVTVKRDGSKFMEWVVGGGSPGAAEHEIVQALKKLEEKWAD